MSEIGTAIVLSMLLYLRSRPLQSDLVRVNRSNAEKVYFYGDAVCIPILAPEMTALVSVGNHCVT